MSLPPLAPFPPPNLRKDIVPEEWELCLDSWLLLTQRYLLLPSKAFAAKILDGSSLVAFLTSYVDASATAHDLNSKKATSLRKDSFLLIHRTFTEVKDIPPALLDCEFLSGLGIVFAKSQSLKVVLASAWNQNKLEEATSMQESKASLISLMENLTIGLQSEMDITREMALARMCYPYAQFLVVGSDLLDSIVTAYNRNTEISLREHLVAFVYVSLSSLMNEGNPRIHTLFDHLYTLKFTSLLKTIIRTTPFLTRFQRHISSRGGDSGRARPLLEEFSKYAWYGIRAEQDDPMRRNVNKGKKKAKDELAHGASDGMHVHKMSLVTELQDLFPDLGSGFIVKLLDEYNDDAEQVTAHLLENNLPPYLRQADRSENFDFPSAGHTGANHDPTPHLAPRNTPPLPPTRHNIHDHDDFDNLAIDASKLHLGRKNENLTADRLLSSDRPSNQKAAILSALATFDFDDDERDDTYDAEDVGGTVDNTFADGEADVKGDKNDEALFNAYKMTPALFNRDWDTRRGQPRSALKRETGMTNEAIEGWAIMLSRDPRRLKQLERVHETSGSQQSALEGTAWSADSGAEDSNAAGVQGGHQGRFRGGGRGGDRGRGRGGRGAGAVAGPANEHDTQVARQRKDASKGSRANHNRRDQRARKMASGGFPG